MPPATPTSTLVAPMVIHVAVAAMDNRKYYRRCRKLAQSRGGAPARWDANGSSGSMTAIQTQAAVRRQETCFTAAPKELKEEDLLLEARH